MSQSLKIATIGAIAGTASLYATAAAPAAVQPIVLPPTFSEDASKIEAAPKGASACTVNFTTLTDERHDKKTIGVFGRPLHSPPDSQAWMYSVLSGLSKRGVTPHFSGLSDADGSGGTQNVPTARFSLRMVWLAPVAVNFSANVIMSVDATTPDGRTFQKTYRGQVTTTNWAGGAGEMESAINKAFSDGLNHIAPDLRGLCKLPA